jgi:4-amino-4-deoxy-L-arabinose transferase-like glycosyltransferase
MHPLTTGIDYLYLFWGKGNMLWKESCIFLYKQGLGRSDMRVIKFLVNPHYLLVICALIIGIVLRLWDFGNLPAGLSTDEASIGVEAASLHYYGIDRNGMSFPVYFISWGSGQNVLYAYLLAPLVPLGLSSDIIRLPMLIAGVLTLLVVYGIARKLFSPSAAIIAIFLMAISPWHIMLSRWALESNLLPFVFSLAFFCLLNVDRNPLWFLACTTLLALSLYAYATAHFLVPLFLLLIVVFLLIKPIISRKVLLAGIALFVLLSIPIFLYIIVNAFQLDPIHLGMITIPRMVSEPRFIAEIGILNGGGLRWYINDLLTLAKILFLHTDELISNIIPPYGFLFPGAILFALVGAFLIAGKIKNQKSIGIWAFGAWLVLAFLLGIIQWPFVSRINIFFIPLILCVTESLDWIIRDKKILFIPVSLGLMAYGVLFWRVYTGSEYRNAVGWYFNNGLIPAIQSDMKLPENPVCITNETDMPYVYVELADFRNPMDYLASIQYSDPNAKYRIVEHMGRYSFGIQNCKLDRNIIYILKNDQKLPLDESLFTSRTFGDYVVYYPKKTG